MLFLKSILLLSIFIFPRQTNLNAEIERLELSSKNYILYSQETQTIIASKNETERLSAASINKVLTTITALDAISEDALDRVITVDPHVLSQVSYEASVAGLESYQEITLRDALYSIMLPSGADAVLVVADYLYGSETEMAAMMNIKAKEIGMHHTHIKNGTGLDDPDQYSTLEDLLTLIKYSLDNEEFKKIYTSSSYTFADGSMTVYNKSLELSKDYYFPYIKGAKSGYTYDAGRALSSYAEKEQSSYIFISTQADEEQQDPHAALKDAISVYNYLFTNFKEDVLIEKGETIESFKIQRRFKAIQQSYQEDVVGLVPDDFLKDKIRVDYEFASDLKAPLKAGSIVGKRSIFYDQELMDVADVKIEEDVNVDVGYILLTIVRYAILFFMFIVSVLLSLRIHHRYKMKKRRR